MPMYERSALWATEVKLSSHPVEYLLSCDIFVILDGLLWQVLTSCFWRFSFRYSQVTPELTSNVG